MKKNMILITLFFQFLYSPHCTLHRAKYIMCIKARRAMSYSCKIHVIFWTPICDYSHLCKFSACADLTKAINYAITTFVQSFGKLGEVFERKKLFSRSQYIRYDSMRCCCQNCPVKVTLIPNQTELWQIISLGKVRTDVMSSPCRENHTTY